jgi:hypothetical protein
MLCASLSKAQGILFSYDAAGNRQQRTIVWKSSEVNIDSIHAVKPITEYLDEMKITIYPNPTQGQLSVEITNMPQDASGEITIHNLEGKQMQNLKTLESANKFDLSFYPMGIYVLRIKVGQKVSEWKIVKE